MTDGKLYTRLSANTIMAKLTNQFQQTRLITSSPDKHYSLSDGIYSTVLDMSAEDDFRAQVFETSVTNISSFQNYPHLDDHTWRSSDTPGFKPFTMSSSCQNYPHPNDHTTCIRTADAPGFKQFTILPLVVSIVTNSSISLINLRIRKTNPHNV